MTWHHVAALIIAGAIVFLCGHSPVCGAAMPGVLQLATTIVGGVFGNMMPRPERRVKPRKVPPNV